MASDPCLTWCTNLHPAGAVKELLGFLSGPAARVKALFAPDLPMGLGLWLPEGLVRELAGGGADRLREALAAGGFFLATANCFPQGRFHGKRVKSRVYLPDWGSRERLDYTLQAMQVVAALAEPGRMVPVSTVPLGPAAGGESLDRRGAAHLLEAVRMAVEIAGKMGVEIVLALEPEPSCRLERAGDLFRWFQEALLPAGAREDEPRRHLGLCLDTCHAAVLGEDPVEALVEARRRGVRVPKVQLASALELAPVGEPGLTALAGFVEPTYLHQSAWLDQEGRVVRAFGDLGEALAAAARGVPPAAATFRTHLHVPLFWEGVGDLRGTAATWLPPLLARRELLPPVLEVETYTWSVLAGRQGLGGWEEGTARELAWVVARQAELGPR